MQLLPVDSNNHCVLLAGMAPRAPYNPWYQLWPALGLVHMGSQERVGAVNACSSAVVLPLPDYPTKEGHSAIQSFTHGMVRMKLRVAFGRLYYLQTRPTHVHMGPYRTNVQCTQLRHGSLRLIGSCLAAVLPENGTHSS